VTVVANSSGRSSPQTVDGRAIGERAEATRRRLLDETARLLDLHGLLDMRVVEVTRAVGTSPATFYQYFTDVDDAILALAAEAGELERELISLISPAWAEPDGYDLVVEFVDQYHRFWSAHRSVLRVRNLKAEEGDPRYQRVRSRSSIPMAEAFGSLARAGADAGRVSSMLDPFATGGAMLGMIERLFVYEDVFGRRGSSIGDLKSTLATILFQTLVTAKSSMR
jgi:AcrR family transcriptional regulator